ncbi:MAG: glutamate racemase [Saprospiraceae bacterium]|nr:glutamate racemase [Saprospiraceae bacterium]MBK6564917.1 glutamate racemase [Saprospiraceae bacterium]MBK8548717.1 glutamate racemase [Saprospiraceae bacterium]MBK8853699.1 glutamate racemase [Saprospiraceae bacterium]MBK9041723.1 glutamate racemase [Saprospiraceae bacterium]
MNPDRPIGIFDSGIGGLTVAKAIKNVLPNEQLIYFGDTVHMPYGDKSADAIRYYCLRISKFLLEQNCKMIVIACNSASSAAYDVLLDFFEGKVFFVNVVDPLVEEVKRKNLHNVGVIATKATIHSSIYKTKIKAINQKIKVSQLATPLLAPMIEEGFYTGNIANSVIENYLNNPELEGIEALLLACTHYPLIKKDIEAFYHHKILVLDSTDVVSKTVKDILEKENLLAQKPMDQDIFYVSDYTTSFEESARMFYGNSIHLEAKTL